MEMPQRKHPRLKDYDYSLPGYYYVTIHTEKDAPVLSRVELTAASAGIAVRLTRIGKVAYQQLYALQQRYGCVKIDKFVIMPNHIHAIICLTEEAAGAAVSPTLMEVVCAYKSLTTRICNRLSRTPGRKLFQTSFYDTVLRNEKAYQECWRYIDENPAKWLLGQEE